MKRLTVKRATVIRRSTQLAKVAAASVLMSVALVSPSGAAVTLPTQSIFGADFNLSVPAQNLGTAMQRARQECPAKAIKPRKLKLATALAGAQRLVEKNAGSKAMKLFRKSADYKSVRRLEIVAAGAAGQGKPLPALAALLRQHQLSKRDPLPLVDAAAVLTGQRKPREALALLDAAARLKSPKDSGMGMNAKAIELNNRAHALLMLGQYAKAKGILKQAIALEPNLAEARTNRSFADLCEGKIPAVYDSGRFRHQPFIPPTGPPPDPGQPPQIDRVLGEYVGVPEGVGHALSFAIPPATAEEAAGAERSGVYGVRYEALAIQSQSYHNATWNDFVSYSAKHPWPSIGPRMVSAMRGGLTKLAMDQGFEGGSQSQLMQSFLALSAMPDCDRARFNAAYNQVADLAASYTFAMTKATDGYMRAVSDPLARESIRLQGLKYLSMTEQNLTEVISDSVQDYSASCGVVPSGSPDVGDTTAAQPDNGGCTDREKKLLLLQVVQVSGRCEDVSVKFRNPSWVGAFLKFTANVQDGSLTVVAGGFVSTETPLPGAKISTETGFYVKIDRNGNVVDYGWQAPKIETSVGKGPVSITTASAGGTKISLVSAASGWPH